MAQHSTPALDDQFPLHPQEIRSAALQAASRITARTQYKTEAAGELALDLAARFETYIEYGSVADVDNTESAGPCTCESCARARRLIDALDDEGAPVPAGDFVCPNCGPYTPSLNATHRCPAIDLVDELAAALAVANEETTPALYLNWRPDAQAAIAVFRARIGAMPSSTTAEDVYRSLFGNIGAAQ